MSLRDTIDAARKEAEGNAALPKKKETDAPAAEEERSGFSRKSVAKAKPVREAGSSVRVESKPKSRGPLAKPESKDEKRERKRKERESDDLRNRAYDVMMRSIPGYKKTERVFWVFLGVGMAFAVLSLVVAYALGGQTDITTPAGIASVVTLVLAYAAIIGGIVYDLVKRRPFRREAESRVRGMTDKKIMELLERDRAERIANKAKKSSK